MNRSAPAFDWSAFLQEGFVARPGDTVILRAVGTFVPEQFERARDILDGVEDRTGVHFVLIDAALEVVHP